MKLSVKFSSVAQSCPTLCDPLDCSTPGFPVHHRLSELTQTQSIESVMPYSHLILCRPLLLLPSIFPSIRVFSNESVLCIRWSKYCFSFSISSSNEYSGLNSFRMDWLDLLAVQGTLKSLLQHHSSKASILWCSAFFTVQLSHPCMTTGKTVALTRRTFVGKVMSLLLLLLVCKESVLHLYTYKHLMSIWFSRKENHCLDMLHSSWSHYSIHYLIITNINYLEVVEVSVFEAKQPLVIELHFLTLTSVGIWKIHLTSFSGAVVKNPLPT